MVHAVQTQPHVWTLLEVDMTNLVRYRDAQKEDFRQRHGFGLSFLPFIAQVVADGLREHPYLNSTWTDDGILLRHYVNLGFAVAVPPDGLIVPVVRDADRLGFTDLARAINDLVERAREKKLKPEDVQAGTFTINNTGATGSVESFSIINQNQAAILNTEAILKRPVVLQNDAIAVRSMMNLTMTFDHRILDGYMAGQFTSYVKRRLEEWSPADLKL
jgi:2-oxoisovalerate dehydrogenase E2 component (dihydrolipoyl transacylase)